jgi:cell wall-associated NlpC family hydrolase
MTVVDAVARVAQLQTELAGLRTQHAQGSTQSAGAGAFAALLGEVADAGSAATTTGQGAAGASGQVTGQQIVQDAEKYLGVPYVFGGESTSGMDCSGLVQTVLGDLGISAPRVVPDQAKIGTPVASLADAQPGDLIVEKGNGHIQIYAGDGMIIEAPKPGESVVKRKEWLSADQIGTIRRVATAAPAADSAAATPATADASAQLAALIVPVVVQHSDGQGAAQASATASSSVAVSQLASLTAALLPGMPGGTDASASLAATAAPVTTSAPAPVPADFSAQLAGPITQLVTQPDGSHTVVVRVVPEQLGPVTVDAHLTEHGLRIELSAPNDAGRDALTGVLGELRRDLAAGGITASVSLGQAATGSSAGDGQAQTGAQQALFELLDENRSVRSASAAAAPAVTVAASALLSPDSLLDVLA